MWKYKPMSMFERALEKELKNTREAFGKHPEAVHAWNIHHEEELEPIGDPIEVRIQYIMRNKPQDEWLTRLRNMRPVCYQLPKRLLKADKVYQKAYQKWCDEYAACQDELDVLHKLDVPNTTWHNGSIFSRGKDK